MTVLRVAVGVPNCSTCVGVPNCSTCCCRCSWLFLRVVVVVSLTVLCVAVCVYDCSTCCCRCS